MKVLLVSENRCMENLVPFPLGIAYVVAAAEQAGHEVMGLDLMFPEDPLREIALRIREFQPDCVGLSVRNIDNQDMHAGEFYLPHVREVFSAIKSETASPVVLGGAGFTIYPLECLDYLDAETGIVGEGEAPFLKFLECLAAGRDPRDLPGVAVRRNGMRKVNPAAPYADLNHLPPPDRTAFDVGRYNWVPGNTPAFVANLQSRRGCHMRCIYCPNPLLEGRAIRLRDPVSVADEMQSLEEEHGIGFVIFTDSLFNYPGDYCGALCREIAGRDLSLRWACSFTPVNPDPGLLESMREAGCTILSIGNESGSEDMLTALRKGFSKDDIVRSVGEAQRIGFKLTCFLLLGGPGETRKSVEESVEFLSELGADMVTVTVGIRIYPGCELHEISLKEGVVSPGQNLLYPTFYLAPEVAPWLRDYMVEVCGERRGWEL